MFGNTGNDWLTYSGRGGLGSPEKENSNTSSQNNFCNAVSITHCWRYTVGISTQGWIFPLSAVRSQHSGWFTVLDEVHESHLCLSVPGGEVWREESRCMELWSHPVCTFSGEWRLNKLTLFLKVEVDIKADFSLYHSWIPEQVDVYHQLAPVSWWHKFKDSWWMY